MATPDKKPQDDLVARRKEIVRPRSRWGRWLGRLALVGYLFGLWWFYADLRQRWPASSDVAWKFDSLDDLRTSAADFGVALGVELLQYFLLGFLVLCAAGRPKFERSSFLRKILLLVTGLGLTTVIRGIEVGGMPGTVDLWAPILGCLIGMTVGSAAIRGRKGIRRLAGWCVVHAMLFLTFLCVVGYFAVDSEPLELAEIKVPAAEKRRLVETIKDAQRHLSVEGDDELREIRLSEEEVKSFSAWGLQTAHLDSKLDVRLEPGTVAAQTSQGFPLPWLGERFLNLHAVAQVNVEEGQPTLRIEELQIGHLGFPEFVRGWVSSGVLAALNIDEDVKGIVESIKRLEVEQAVATLAVHRGAFSKKVLPSIQSKLGVSPELVEATKAQLENLVAKAGDYPPGERRFPAIVQEAFRLAQERSQANDPLLENRAALLAMGILMGHHRVADLSGSREAVANLEMARRRIGMVSIRGRSDWTQHFCVSAALVVLSDTVTSDLVGVMKEEIDSGGGSGFSFADLLADRAGTTFAEVATKNETSARKLQAEVADGFQIDELFPAAADLPEGLQEAEFKAKYGGVDSPQYREVLNEIERRLKGCALLQL